MSGMVVNTPCADACAAVRKTGTAAHFSRLLPGVFFVFAVAAVAVRAAAGVPVSVGAGRVQANGARSEPSVSGGKLGAVYAEHIQACGNAAGEPLVRVRFVLRP